MPVNGDLSKALYSPKVGALARSLLFSVSNITRDVAGTQELRRRARSITNAIRIAFGLPSFLTKSSDENHNAIMLRCARLSDDDPYFRNCNADMQRMYGRQYPPLVDWDKQSREMLPDYEVRRRVLCHSAVSAVDGFKIHTRLSFKYIYGMRLCMQCPRCEHSKEPDSFVRMQRGCPQKSKVAVLDVP